MVFDRGNTVLKTNHIILYYC